MYTRLKSHERYFFGVALALILSGAAIVAIGVVQWILNQYSSVYIFAFPSMKIIGGLIVLALGYIHLELELLRTK